LVSEENLRNLVIIEKFLNNRPVIVFQALKKSL
jgi:hypothetical protein